jgi:hypothetical protein
VVDRLVRGRRRLGLAKNSAAFRFDRHLARLGQGRRLGCHGRLGSRRLGLERLERAQRAPELGERAAAIAQQGVEGSGTVAVADQGVAEAPARKAVLGEQFCFEPLGPLEPPGRSDDPARERGLERALRRQLLEQRRLERGELGGTLARQHDVLLRAKTMLERVLCRAGLALGRLGPARLGAVATARRGARAG